MREGREGEKRVGGEGEEARERERSLSKSIKIMDPMVGFTRL